MEEKMCQSCGMPLCKEEEHGTVKGGGKSDDYCVYCYKEGEFIEPDMTLEEMIAYTAQFAEEAGISEEEMIRQAKEGLPTLKRWKKD